MFSASSAEMTSAQVCIYRNGIDTNAVGTPPRVICKYMRVRAGRTRLSGNGIGDALRLCRVDDRLRESAGRRGGIGDHRPSAEPYILLVARTSRAYMHLSRPAQWRRRDKERTRPSSAPT